MPVPDNLAIPEMVVKIADGDAETWNIMFGNDGPLAAGLMKIAKCYPSVDIHPQTILWEKMPLGHKRWEYIHNKSAKVVRSYIIKVLKNAFLDQVAAQKKVAEHEQTTDDQVGDEIEGLPDSSLPVDEEYEKKVLHLQVNAALARLFQCKHERSVIIIRHHDLAHETMETVAKRIGITRNNADQIRHRNLEKLRKIAPELESFIS